MSEPTQLDLFETPVQGTRSRDSGACESQTIVTARHGPARPGATLEAETSGKTFPTAGGVAAPVPDGGLPPDDSDWLEMAWR